MRRRPAADLWPIRIGIDGRWLTDHYPGIGRYVYNLLASLPREMVGEELVVPWGGADQSGRFDPSGLDGCKLRLVTGGDRPALGGQMAIRSFSRSASLDLFHATYFPGALGVHGVRVVSIHDLIPFQLPETIPSRPRRLLYRLTLRRAAAGAHRILTPTDAVRRQVIERLGISPDRVVAIPFAPDPGFTLPSEAQLASTRERLGLPDRYLLWLGVNKPHKNLPRLLEAWAMAARQSIHGCRLVLAGAVDRAFPRPEERAERLAIDDLVFLGGVEERDLAALYAGAEALLLPSLAEGFGLPVLEAMACQTPVACSDIAPLREVAGDAALTFDPLAPEVMAAAIGRLIHDADLRRELRRRGRERVQRFSWRQTARRTLEIYHEALRGSSPSTGQGRTGRI